MKTISKILTAVAVLAIANKSQAQATTSADAFATIITPITIAKAGDLNFGNIAIKSVAGTVVVGHDNSRSSTGGVTLPAGTGTVSAASFTVSGEGGRTYAITLPSSAASLARQGAGATETMSVDTFVSNPSGTGTLAAGGTQTVKVGATLNVAANQAAGTYKGSFDVTVNYN